MWLAPCAPACQGPPSWQAVRPGGGHPAPSANGTLAGAGQGGREAAPGGGAPAARPRGDYLRAPPPALVPAGLVRAAARPPPPRRPVRRRRGLGLLLRAARPAAVGVQGPRLVLHPRRAPAAGRPGAPVLRPLAGD